jgi:hypothetical protein
LTEHTQKTSRGRTAIAYGDFVEILTRAGFAHGFLEGKYLDPDAPEGVKRFRYFVRTTLGDTRHGTDVRLVLRYDEKRGSARGTKRGDK